MLITRRAAIAGVAGVSACSSGPVRVPFVEAHPHILIPVEVDGRAATALLDNGAPVSVLDKGFAAAGAEARRARLNLGGAQLSVWPLVDNLSHVANTAEQPVQAICGYEVFQRWTVGFDFVGKTIALGGGAPKGAQQLKLKPRGYRQHTVEVTCGGAPATGAILDLGCSTAILIGEDFCARHGLAKGLVTSHRMAPVFVAGGMADLVLMTFRLPSVSFAGRTFRDVPVDVLPKDAGPFSGMDLVLGAPILNRFDLLMDLPAARMWAAANGRAGEAFERRTVGISSEVEAGGLRVRHVAENSPAAAAGVLAGELIATINGAAASKRAIRTAQPGQRLEMVMAGGTRRVATAGYYY